MSVLSHISLALKKLGARGTVLLIAEKYAKKTRLKQLFALAEREFKKADVIAWEATNTDSFNLQEDKESVLKIASEMLDDENLVFTFRHHLRNIDDPWNFDPLEKKYWRKQQYEETQLHLPDVPKDVKIVWEVNRFKYLPLLAEAAFFDGGKQYADECQFRIHSWIDGNPFVRTINWSSPLELSIRAIAWLTSIQLLRLAGFDIVDDKIKRSLWEHAYYLHSQLSVDKIVKTNHLVGEAAGIYIISSLCDFSEAKAFRRRALSILETEILAQTYPDGVSRESSGWYHTFVTDFFDLAERTSRIIGETFSKKYLERLAAMKTYSSSIIAPDREIVRYGDCDDGSALYLSDKSKDFVFGASTVLSSKRENYFKAPEHITALVQSSFLFMRSGEFGWGGDGFASHAHDDLLSPILYLTGLPVLVDSGTFVYNGDHPKRDSYRIASAHNGLIIGDNSPGILKQSFGWLKVRADATLKITSDSDSNFSFESSYGEYQNQHKRRGELTENSFVILDEFTFQKEQAVSFFFHFDPRWKLSNDSGSRVVLKDAQKNEVVLSLSGVECDVALFDYKYSPSYRVAEPAKGLRIETIIKNATLRIEFTRTSR